MHHHCSLLVKFALLTFCTFVFACSEAETPNAFEGVTPPPSGDAGVTGLRDTPCLASNACADDTLVCVIDGESICRLLCVQADPDPCGERQTCDPLTDDGNPDTTDFACLPD